MKTSELTGISLDWAVAKCEGMLGPDGIRFSDEYCDSLGQEPEGDFTNDWAQGGPIIEREGIEIFPIGICNVEWGARKVDSEGDLIRFYGDTPLIAAMRCFVASKLGEEVEVPEALIPRD
jgi:hypothetical protein